MHYTRLSMVAMAALVFSLALAAQAADQATPSASRVTQIMGTLDRNNDGKISNSEAPPELQQNFAFIDANGDGGIDLEELTRMLNMGASQRGSARSGVASGRTAGLGSPTNGPTFGTLNPVAANQPGSRSPSFNIRVVRSSSRWSRTGSSKPVNNIRRPASRYPKSS